MNRRLRVLYVVYWGATEPIGRSGTVPTVCRLAREQNEDVYLVTFDKPEDIAVEARRKDVEQTLLAAGVRWTDLIYHRRPVNLSSFYDIARGVRHCVEIVRREGIDVIHGRTMPGATIASVVSRLTGVPHVVHPDGFWPEERVDDGIWREDSIQVFASRRMHWDAYRHADGIIVLSERAVDRVMSDPIVKRRNVPIRALHTSVEVERFGPKVERRSGAPFHLMYLGSCGGRYRSPELFRFFARARARDPEIRISVVSRTERARIDGWMRDAGLGPNDVSVRSAETHEVPGLLAEADAGVFFLDEGLSNFATSSTKVGEYLAGGLPVLVTQGCGDQDLLLQRTRTGVVLGDFTDDGMDRGLDALRVLAHEPGIAARAQQTARDHMGVSHCAAVQANLHHLLVAARAPSTSAFGRTKSP